MASTIPNSPPLDDSQRGTVTPADDAEPELEVLTWADYGNAGFELAKQVVDDGYRPDIILAIARGGLFPAGSLGYALSIKNLYVMNMEYYVGVDERRDVPVMLPPYLELADLTDLNVLVVDDVSDTGHTLRAVLDFVRDHAKEVRSAVLYEKSRTVVNCEYVWRHTDLWIKFPWDFKNPLLLPGGQTPPDA